MKDYDNVFTIMPMNQRFLLEPGQVYEGSVMVVNPADAKADFHYKVSVTPYSVLGANYQADLSTVSDRSEIIKWIDIKNSTGVIEPNGVAKIDFTITVPEGAIGGGQYATIAVGSDNEENSASDSVSVNNIYEMASIIYAEVRGDINHVGQIKSNDIPSFVAAPPVTIGARVTNEGNSHEDVTIVTKATNFFTGEVILPTEENSGKYTEIVMPGTERYVTQELDNMPMIGVVHIEQTVYYLGISSVEFKEVLICPIWFMLLVAVTVLAVIGLIIRIIIGHRKKKRRIKSELDI